MSKLKNYEPYKHTSFDTIKDFAAFLRSKHNEKTAFMYQEKKKYKSVSYKEFVSDIEALGTYLFSKGFKNCHIAVFGENSYEWILTHFAVTTGKNVIVPIDKELEADDIEYLLTDSECKAIFYSGTYFDIIDSLKEKELPGVEYISLKKLPKMIEEGRRLLEEGYTEYKDVTVSKDDLASIVYTSGTTGRSKGVMLTHGNIVSNMYAASCNVIINGSTILLLPLHHAFGLVAGLFAVMNYGEMVYINKSLKKIIDDFKVAKPQNTFAVPLIAETLYKNIWINARKQGKEELLSKMVKLSNALRKVGIDLRKVFFKSVIEAFGGELNLMICGGAPIKPELIKDFDALGIKILNGYGITECSPIVAVNRNEFNVLGSVGIPLCCNEVKISDEGEVLVKGSNVMQGYYHNEAANKEVFTDDGWFRTGDIGRIDEYGALHITGRIKNLIILANGENIAAEAIENLVYDIPYVKEVICYGEDDLIVAEMFLDEEVKDGKDRINADIQELNNKLPQIRNIGKIVLRETEFPKTTTKKIKRNYGGTKK